MARIVKHEQTGPYRIDPQDFPKDGKSIFICACGLSNRLPFCDGSHKACRDEEGGKTYLYESGTRKEVEPPGPGPT